MTETPIDPMPPAATVRPAHFRWKAFGVHLSISLAILGILLYLLFFHWFPGYLFDTDGGWQALRVIAGVDIILGPMLTLIAANPRKTGRELRKDFAVIGIVQAAALSAGVWLAWDNRPYALFWYDGSFQSQPWSSFHGETDATKWIQDRDAVAPTMVYVELPDDLDTRARLFRDAFAAGTSAMFTASLYRTWPGDAPRIAHHAAAARKWIAEDSAREQMYRETLARLHLDDALTLPMPTLSRYNAYFLLLKADTLLPIDMAPIRPPDEMLSGQFSAKEAKEAALIRAQQEPQAK